MSALDDAKRHGIDLCRDPSCEPCAAQRAYDAELAVRANERAVAWRALGEALVAPARWVWARPEGLVLALGALVLLVEGVALGLMLGANER